MVDQQTETGSRWYVIHTYSGYEDRVKKNLDQRVLTMDVKEKIFRVVVPTEDEIEIRDGQRRTVARKVFPGYILVEMVVDDESWYVGAQHAGRHRLRRLGQPPHPPRG